MLPMTITQTVYDNRRITVELPDVEPGTLVTVLVIPATITAPAIDAQTARRTANGWLLDHVGDLVMGKNPRLVSDGKRAWWRVAAYVTNVYRAPHGPIGFVDVDALSGAVLSDETTAQEIANYGTRLDRHPLAADN